MTVVRRRSDADDERWITDMRDGSPAERERALAHFQERATLTKDPDDRNALGIALHDSGRHLEADAIFGSLISEYPDEPAFRFNLAASLSQREQVDLVRYHLREIAQNASSEDARRFAQEELDGYEAFVGATESDERLRRIQTAAFEEKLRHGDAQAEDFVALARILLSAMRVTGDESLLARATETLENGAVRFPENAAILEHLLVCYVRSDPHDRMAAVSLELERVAPESPMLRALGGTADPEAEAFVRERWQRTWELFGRVVEGAPDERAAALNELHRIVADAPENPHYRCTYAMALLFSGNGAAAAAEADRLVDARLESHTFHFNLAQVLRGLDRPNDARVHLALADELASNDQERTDVANVRSEWAKHA
jgi:hypothetical protein